jgi:peptidoglycan/LPS O-acetylase OafA/YrhL
VARFLVRRGLKIYPVFYVFMAYLFLVPVAKTILRGGDAIATLSERWFDLWPNLLFLNNYLHDAVGHTWSLAVEEHFYLTLPFVILALASSRRMNWLLPLCLAVALLCLGLRYMGIATGSPLAERMAATHFRVDALLFGVGIRAIAEFHPAWFLAARQRRGTLLLLGGLLWAPNLFIAPDDPWVLTLGLTGTFVGSGAFVLAAYHTNAADFGRWRGLVTPTATLLAWVGTFSYATYVWHVTVFGILEREVSDRIVHWAGGTSQWAWLLATVIVCWGAILAGMVATRVVEWPMLRLRDRLFPSRSKSLPE